MQERNRAPLNVFLFYTVIGLAIWLLPFFVFAVERGLPTWQIGDIRDGETVFNRLELEPVNPSAKYIVSGGSLLAEDGTILVVQGVCIVFPQRFCSLRTGTLNLYLYLDEDWNGRIELWSIASGQILGAVDAMLLQGL